MLMDSENLRELINIVSKRSKHKSKILLQIPEGLKYNAIEIIDNLKRLGHDVVLSAEPCYGACDIKDYEAKKMGCDLILHLGHKKFYKKFKTIVPVIYFPIKLSVKYNPAELKKISYKKIGLISTIQHVETLKDISRDLKNIGKSSVIGGEILGCYTKNASKIEKNVDCFLFVGSGEFHASGLVTEKPVYIFDLEKNKVRLINKMKRLKILHANLAKLDDAKKVGILISTKKGQFFDLNRIEKLKNRLKKMNKKAYVLVMDNITNEKLTGLKIDYFINTACPRIVENVFDKPVINARDLFGNI